MYFMFKTYICQNRVPILDIVCKNQVCYRYFKKKSYKDLSNLNRLFKCNKAVRSIYNIFSINKNQSKVCLLHISTNYLAQSNIRKICTSVPLRILGDKVFHEHNRKGNEDEEEKTVTLKDLKEGFWQMKTEVRKWREEIKEKFEADPIYVRPGDTDIVFRFQSDEDLKPWTVVSDSDHDQGYSYGSLTLSPNGKGLFSGKTDTTVIKDGKASLAGYSNMTVIQPRKSFMREKNFDWMSYTHLVMRVRGDGRRYIINLLTPGSFDITWFDMYNYVLYTRGGPYWQDVKIPFSKFFWNAKGMTQDRQQPLNLTRVKKVGITAGGNITGPFRLEIDYIGVHLDPTHTETFAYEQYRIPSYLI